MRIVIGGAGEVGYNLAKTLCRDNEVVVIEQKLGRRPILEELDVKLILGNAANTSVLKNAEVGKADIFVGVTGDDEVNLLACYAAHRMGAKKTIARVSNPEYVDQPVIFNHPLGIDVLVCPELVLASEIASLVRLPGAIDIELFAEGAVEMMEGVIEDNSPLCGKRVSELELPEGCLILGIIRNGNLIIPRGETQLSSGDRVILLGVPDSIVELQSSLKESTEVERIAIIGGGTVGAYIARMLEDTRLHVKILESNPERCEELSKMLSRTRIIHGDGTDIDLLLEEEIQESDVVIATTDSDEKNLLCSLLSKSLGAKKAISRVEKEEYIRLFQTIGVDIALSPRTATYIQVLRQMRKMKVHTMVEIEYGMADLLEIEVARNSKVAGKSVGKLKLPRNAIIGMIIREGEPIIPKGTTVLKEGDKVLVLFKPEVLKKLEKMFA